VEYPPNTQTLYLSTTIKVAALYPVLAAAFGLGEKDMEGLVLFLKKESRSEFPFFAFFFLSSLSTALTGILIDSNAAG
jgi:hypothetical protein